MLVSICSSKRDIVWPGIDQESQATFHPIKAISLPRRVYEWCKGMDNVFELIEAGIPTIKCAQSENGSG